MKRKAVRSRIGGVTLFEATAALCAMLFAFVVLLQIYQWCVARIFCQYSSFYASKGMTLGYKLNLVRRGARVAAIAISGDRAGVTGGSETADAGNYMSQGDASGVWYRYWYPQSDSEPELHLHGRYGDDYTDTAVTLRNFPLISESLARVFGIADAPEPSATTRNYDYSQIYMENQP